MADYCRRCPLLLETEPLSNPCLCTLPCVKSMARQGWDEACARTVPRESRGFFNLGPV